MTRDEVCTCAQYSQCCVCNKSRSNYAELMAENERLKERVERQRSRIACLTDRAWTLRRELALLKAARDEEGR